MMVCRELTKSLDALKQFKKERGLTDEQADEIIFLYQHCA